MQSARILFLGASLPLLAAAQAALSRDAAPAQLPKLEHFSATFVDSSVSACDDFLPVCLRKVDRCQSIPADQPAWSTAGPLQLWNETLLVQTLEKIANNDPQRSAKEQKVGDYYFACMDEKASTNTRESGCNRNSTALRPSRANASLPARWRTCIRPSPALGKAALTRPTPPCLVLRAARITTTPRAT